MKNRVPFDVKVNMFLEGEHKSSTEDVFRRIAQHLFNNAVQRKRKVVDNNNKNIVLPLTKEEQEILDKTETLLIEIDELKDHAKTIGNKCAELTKALDVILDKYVMEIPDSIDE
jgi:hypothetical protein